MKSKPGGGKKHKHREYKTEGGTSGGQSEQNFRRDEQQVDEEK